MSWNSSLEDVAAAGRGAVAFEFRQPYVSPAIASYGEVLRAGDCPGDSVVNRISTLNARMLSVGQVVLRWQVQCGSVPIPMSGNADRQRANLELSGFELSDADMSSIAGLERGSIWGQDPDVYEEF